MSEQASTPCSSPEASQFDFWIGEWDLTWPAEQTGGAAGEHASGTNVIIRTFGGCVVEENFATDDGGFMGRSLSVYDPDSGLWRQTWVDSTGGYLLFEGGARGEEMELRTTVTHKDGDRIVQRMVFSDITNTSLTWHWQGSRDGGESWTERWTISYERRA